MSDNRFPHLFSAKGLFLTTAAALCSISLTGCSTSFWKTAEAAEESAVEPNADAAAETGSDVADASEEPAANTPSEEPATQNSATAADKAEQTVAEPKPVEPVSIEPQLETLRASLRRTASYRKLRTKKARASFAREAALQIDLGLTAVDSILSAAGSELDEQREAWKGRLTLLNRGEQLKLPEFPERLDRAVAEATIQPEFQAEAEYGSGLVLVNRYFTSGKLQRTLECLQEHARSFPDGSSTARLFLTFARDCGERGKFGAGILCCRIALWQLNNHPDIGAVRNLLENLQAGRTVDPSQDKVQQLLQKEVGVLRQALPIQIDRVTTCTSITTGYHEVTYGFRVSLSPSLVKANEDKIKSSITKMARTTYQTQHLLEQGVTLHYVYSGNSGQELLRFSVSK